MLVLIGLFCLQASPEIERAEILTGGAFRPGHWAPLEIRIRSGESIEGELVVRTDFGFSIVKPILLPKGVSSHLLPALALSIDAPLEVVFRRGGEKVARLQRKLFGRGLYQSDLLIRATGDVTDEKVVLFDWRPGDNRLEWLEAVDVVTGIAPAGYEEMGGIIAENLSDALVKVRARGKFDSRWFEPVDQAVYELAPEEGWIMGQRNFLVWFSILYLFAAILVLGGIAFWRPRFLWVVVLLLPACACAVVYFCFPGGSVVVVRQPCEMGRVRADIYFVRGKTEVTFPGLVKPLFGSYRDAKNEKFELVVEENLTKIQREKDGWSVVTRVRGDIDRKLWRVENNGGKLNISGTLLDGEALIRGETVHVGDVRGSHEVKAKGARESKDPVYRYFRRKIIRKGNFLYGRLTREVRMEGDVQARDLAEIREEPGVIIMRIKDN